MNYWGFIPVLLLISAIGAPRAQADTFTYSFVGASVLSGTNFTVVDTSGPAPFNVNLTPLLASPADLFESGFNAGILTDIVFIPAAEMGLASNLGVGVGIILPASFSPSVAGSYAGVFNSNPAGTLTVAETTVATPEPSSVALMVAGMIGLLFVIHKRLA